MDTTTCSRHSTSLLSLLPIAALLVGCQGDRVLSADAVAPPALSVGPARPCPEANYVATDEASLQAALGVVAPGETIGIDGMIQLSTSAFVTTDEVTITCATPGSGLSAAPGSGVTTLLRLRAAETRVDRLVIDGSGAVLRPFDALNNGTTAFADRVQITNNHVTCGPQSCLLFQGVAGAFIADNTFEAGTILTGIHMQGQGPIDPNGQRARPIDGTVIERNTIAATASTSISFGGIRVRDGVNVMVRDNVVTGGWTNSMSQDLVSAIQINKNRFEGASGFALRMFTSDHSLVFTNHMTGASIGGMLVDRSCDNTFVGNNLQGNTGNLGAVFGVETGSNLLAGNSTIIVDDGDLDCTGDGVPDPNSIEGSPAVKPGPIIGPAMRLATTIYGQDGIALR